MDPIFELGLQPLEKHSRDAVRRLVEQLKEAIGDGRLAPGSRLPSTRQAQDLFGVSRNTVAEVYDQLCSEGLIVARHGSGTYVADAPPPLASRAAPAHPMAYRLNPIWERADLVSAMRFWNDPAPPPREPKSATAIDLRPALVDSRLFPFDDIRRTLAKQLRTLETRPSSLRSPQGNQGNFALRSAITRHIAVTRAVACLPEDVLVTSGAQQGFDLLARVLVTPGQTVVALEDPGYPPMRAAFAAAGARVVSVGVDSAGLMVGAIPSEASIICLCPSHQFPLGVTMSQERRNALVALARARGAVIVEDDYDGEFRFDGEPLAALRSKDAADVVFYVGTFSKCMLPTLRLGFVVAPPWAMATLVLAKNCLDWHCPTAMQMAVASFIAEGRLTQHVRKMRHMYRQRRQLLTDALQGELGAWLELIPSSYGMHLGAYLRDGIDAENLLQRLAQGGVKMHSFARYYAGGHGRPGLVFGYGAADLSQLELALALLRCELAKSPGRQRRLG
ncbi:MocR-like pyridoxine biosynthesis transcription factor PdxR [Massilia eburnea]|uniref:MocR-like pyridoxine biosynthesis transcription factor PdxR n=1 Tax=Massilia eburnea TaxID=1776165 RepID=UPI001BA602C7|nr:PLP-dependent aminotransferase family protein [Massilia eburnea]